MLGNVILYRKIKLKTLVYKRLSTNILLALSFWIGYGLINIITK